MTWTGLPSGPALLAAVEVNGTPMFGLISLGSFDANGLWTVLGTVPPELADAEKAPLWAKDSAR